MSPIRAAPGRTGPFEDRTMTVDSAKLGGPRPRRSTWCSRRRP